MLFGVWRHPVSCMFVRCVRVTAHGSIRPFSLLYNILPCGSAMTCAPLSLDGHLDSLFLGLCDKVADEYSCSLPQMHMYLHICWFCA